MRSADSRKGAYCAQSIFQLGFNDIGIVIYSTFALLKPIWRIIGQFGSSQFIIAFMNNLYICDRTLIGGCLDKSTILEFLSESRFFINRRLFISSINMFSSLIFFPINFRRVNLDFSLMYYDLTANFI